MYNAVVKILKCYGACRLLCWFSVFSVYNAEQLARKYVSEMQHVLSQLQHKTLTVCPGSHRKHTCPSFS